MGENPFPSNNEPLNGDLEQVRIFNRALSASDVLQQYNSTSEPSTIAVPTLDAWEFLLLAALLALSGGIRIVSPKRTS